MEKEELLNSEFLKQFKSGDELNSFLHELQKRGVEQLLEGEMDAHLGYDKNQISENTKADAEAALDRLEQKWNNKYSYAIKS